MISIIDKWLNLPLSGITWQTVIFSLFLSFVLGSFISFIYGRTNRGFSYESSFHFTLTMLTIIVTTIMLTIGSNIALSLGLIGSLSIIRFRTVIKNTVDMAFLFWAIATGLAVGAKSYNMAVGCVAFISIIIYLMGKTKFIMKGNSDYILVVNVSGKEKEQALRENISTIFSQNNLLWNIKSSLIDNETREQEHTYSISTRNIDSISRSIEKIKAIDHVSRVSLLTPETNLFL